MRRRFVVLLTIAMLTACTSVPLSTMWKMRDLTVDRFFENDPTALRVAVQVDRALKRGPEQPRVTAEVRAKGPPRCYAFSLVPVDPSAPAELTLDTPAAQRAWSVFALSPAGVDAFRRARREVAGAPTATEGEFKFGVTMSKVFDIPDDAKHFPVRIDVVLDRRDGYFTLVKETDVDIKRTPAPATATPATKPADACPPN